MKALHKQSPIEIYNQQFEDRLLQTTYSSLKRPCDNPHVNFKLLRTVKPHGISYALFEQHVGHRYSKKCECIMCVAVTRGQVIGILPEPVEIKQKPTIRPFVFSKPVASLPEPPKKRPIIQVSFGVN